MRWDIRDSGKRFADRYVLVAGHTNPVVYATLAVLNEALRIRFKQTGDKKYKHFLGDKFQLVWEDLLFLRRNGGLPGHAEMEGKTLFFKFNTGPSGHGSPAAAGEALAFKIAKTPEVKVFAFEGEGGLTTGASHETMNSAWGLGLGNLIYFLDWNDFGIDPRPFSSIVYGTPEDWFGSHGWHVEGTMDGENWGELTKSYYKLLIENADPKIPKVVYGRTTKGRGYHKIDYASHGAAHKRNSELFSKTKQDFADKYNVDFFNFKGQKISLNNYVENTVMINFWATWCAPCRKEMPSLDKIKSLDEFKELYIIPINIGGETNEKSKFFFVYSCPQYTFVSFGKFLNFFKELNI